MNLVDFARLIGKTPDWVHRRLSVIGNDEWGAFNAAEEAGYSPLIGKRTPSPY